MSNISPIDANIKIETSINIPDLCFRDVLSSPFKIHGVFYEDGKFRRMPQAIAQKVSQGVHTLHANTAGGRVRFRTDSPYIAIHAQMSGIGKMSHFALCGSAGFDLYAGNQFYDSFIPPFDIQDGYEGVINFPSAEMRDIIIHFPLYSNVDRLYIGLKSTASLLPPKPYRIEEPIVYYGSSITQGGCASRPGTAYQGFVSRALDADFVNLGFAANAKAEEDMAAYIQTLSMSAFVYDYDHNAPTVEHLSATHERMFLEIRRQQPHLPIIMMSRPKAFYNQEEEARFAIIKATYENAIAKGDTNVYLIDGRTLMQIAHAEGTVDLCHPTDLGFFSMAQALIKQFKHIFQII